MNPVDHVSCAPLPWLAIHCSLSNQSSSYSLTVVVTTSISVRPRPSPATPPRVKRPVSLPPAEPVCSVVPRRPRIKRDITWSFLCDGLKMDFCYETHVLRRVRISVPCALSELRLWPPSFSFIKFEKVMEWGPKLASCQGRTEKSKSPFGGLEMIHL